MRRCRNCLAFTTESYVICRAYTNEGSSITLASGHNPMIWVTIEEAQGVAREERHFQLCQQIWEFLMRNGYINFGCLQVPQAPVNGHESRNIIVVGAGIAGLAAARQLRALLSAFHQKLKHRYEVTLVEGRPRIGGRVYSHTLATGTKTPGERVDLGAQIVTGFSGGNPLTILLQRQLVYPYRSLIHAKNNQIYGLDGHVLDVDQDLRVEGLFNLLLDVAAHHGHSGVGIEDVSKGIVKKIDANMDAQLQRKGEVADKLLGVSKVLTPAKESATESHPLDELRRLGYRVFGDQQMLEFERSKSLGVTMMNILEGLCKSATICEDDRTVLQWHWANMEYACGTNLDNLSLEHWDQDDGNEFRGHHAIMVGGYSKLARGLALAPEALSIRVGTIVQKVTPLGVVTSTGETISADKIVITVPLGVLKANVIEFSPPLPVWKLEAIENLGYGLLNKVVLVYEKQFWAKNIDLIGSIPAGADQLNSAEDRGRFYMFWDCTSPGGGRPVLVALMAGDAAYLCETTQSQSLVSDATAVLQSIHQDRQVPAPIEHIVTKWGQDPFSRGSYSFIGRNGTGKDYESMAKSVEDRWYFAGEATCRTHPATVHGAYLSGLAAAKDVIESIIGEQSIPTDKPLVPAKSQPGTQATSPKDNRKRKADTQDDAVEDDSKQQISRLEDLQKARLTKEKDDLGKLIAGKLGAPPERPKRSNANPFLVFQKDQWHKCRIMADELQKKRQNNPDARATKNQIRACLGQTWRDTTDEDKQKWLNMVNERRKNYDVDLMAWQVENTRWQQASLRLQEEFDRERPKYITREESELLQSQRL
ncbi:putative Flavin-containing amine oxidase [Taphrina deformans PYCC 5710]|uniref:Flavin-containing amine oxidase n=1 Tax=Taphrina deformans (strain PYCC 5710 / ATCC 11124 / CBS 356.35 / IMI 108563 / JCM 9778 / NBRC 8474) TaxID=1097556 RepID=R4X703_TAPDE|nr:putative Flavin-containing amine oxidase [Taphrina deformans PYCC 5710]|eukprot:CCG81016.1 putative Flavin-containing amine oxidase [Taphrina deformans PYCC 5710]